MSFIWLLRYLLFKPKRDVKVGMQRGSKYCHLYRVSVYIFGFSMSHMLRLLLAKVKQTKVKLALSHMYSLSLMPLPHLIQMIRLIYFINLIYTIGLIYLIQ